MNRLVVGFVLGGRYELTRWIASGGMADVWEATDAVLQRQVAAKIMRASTRDEIDFARRFRAEAHNTAGLSHVNIATVFDYGEADGLAFLIMELVPGRPLSKVLREDGPPSFAQVRSILGQAALALAAAHDAHLVHRDVKPANIMLTDEGVVKLTDFGIARSWDASGHTRPGDVLGTPFYLSPEQALGQEATGASDLYALGVVGHEMITGRRPFDKDTPVATALSQVQDPPPPLPDDVPDDLRDVIMECLEKAPEDRPRSAREVALRLGTGIDPAFAENAEPASAVIADEEPEPDPPAPRRAIQPDDDPPTPARRAVVEPRQVGAGRVSWLWIPVSVALTAMVVVLVQFLL